MLAPLNEYYTDEEYEYAVRQMYRIMERNRIRAMASIILKEKASLCSSSKDKIKVTADETKTAIEGISSQIYTAIQGQVRKKIEQVTQEKTDEYDKII